MTIEEIQTSVYWIYPKARAFHNQNSKFWTVENCERGHPKVLGEGGSAEEAWENTWDRIEKEMMTKLES